MLIDDTTAPKTLEPPTQQRSRISYRTYVSKHFKQTERKTRRKLQRKPSPLPSLAVVNVNDLSTDSSLTDIPSDIGPDPFEVEVKTPTRVEIVKAKGPIKSPYFPNKPRPHFIACLPFPPLADTSFGLMQEKLAHNPFRLLVATIFLNKTPGERAMPVFYQLMKMYPTVDALAGAEVRDVTTVIHQLGFQNQRARKCIQLAKKWLQKPPERDQRTRKLHYPRKGDGRDVGLNEILADNDPRVAWEISHLPGLGPYSHDSWRIFCRDELRGLSTSWLGQGATDADFDPEWKRVVPADKELRAYLTWMWLKEGWVWNKETGGRTVADEATLQQARGGGVVLDEDGKQHLVVRAEPQADIAEIEQPAGNFIPCLTPAQQNGRPGHDFGMEVRE